MSPPSLEQKFELLEARFTQPLGGGSSRSFPYNHSNSHYDHSNLSEHSFSFSASHGGSGGGGEVGGLSSSSSRLSKETVTATSSPSSSSSTTSATTTTTATTSTRMMVRSKQQPSTLSSLEIVNRAAAKHLQKVVANKSAIKTTTAPTMTSPTGFSSHHNNHSNFSHHSNSSQQTLLTGNVRGGHRPQPPPPQRIVAESPPMLVSPQNHHHHHHGDKNGVNHKNTTTVGTTSTSSLTTQPNNKTAAPSNSIQGPSPPKPHVARTLLGNTTNNHNNKGMEDGNTSNTTNNSQLTTPTTTMTTHSTAAKRKSNPKRKIPSIKDRLQDSNNSNGNAETNTTSTIVNAAATTATTTAAAAAAATTTTTSSETATSMASPEPSSSSKRARIQNTENNHTSATIATTNGGASRSPKSTSSSFTNAFSEHSRDRSNQGMMAGTTTSKSYNKKVIAPPANNKRIHDFFVSKKKPTDHAMAAAKGDHNNGIKEHGSTTQPHKHTNSTTVTTTSTTTTTTAAVTAIGAISAGAVIGSNNRPNEWSSSSSSSSVAAIDWETQCAKLQQQLQDKEEQLKAVSNNKTILHTALQSALASTKKELTQLQESSKYQQERMMSVMEDLLRWRSDKEAKDLRETLAADGARLGRIVYARTGMRAVESWEEGYATRDLEQRKEALKRTRKALDERQRRQQQPDSQPPLSGTGGVDPTVDPTVARLEAQEGREALHMHLETLRQQEQELLAEEQALNDEKGAHIRALKRVASEDSSRFRTRPKLHDRYVLDRLLGKGGFSEVWRGYDLQELREVAVKIHQLDPRWPDSKKENYTKHVTREYEIHRNVRHPRIVSLYDVFEIDANSFATVLECCKGTDLDSLLKSKKRLPERQARSILLQILSGMRYLSQPSGSRQGIIHYDLKPGNILFDEFGDAKITDFGLSKIVDAPDPAESMELTSQGAGTYWYLPPECFVTGEQVRISNKVDVWSIGVIFYQMLFGRRPFGEGKSQDKLLADHTMLNAHQVYMPDRPAVSDGGKEFLRQCLMYDQAFRPTIAQLCENPYVLQDGIVQADSSKKTD